LNCDNRQEKAAARLDQLSARSLASVLALLFASLLRNLLSNHLVYLDLQQRSAQQAPLHPFAVSLAISSVASLILWAMKVDNTAMFTAIATTLEVRGRDPNWRRRPSHLDQLRGTTAPPLDDHGRCHCERRPQKRLPSQGRSCTVSNKRRRHSS